MPSAAPAPRAALEQYAVRPSLRFKEPSLLSAAELRLWAPQDGPEQVPVPGADADTERIALEQYAVRPSISAARCPV